MTFVGMRRKYVILLNDIAQHLIAGQQKLVKKQNKSLFAQFQSIDFKTIVAAAFDDKNYAGTQYNIFKGT